MKVPERNRLIAECVHEVQKIHDEFFPRGKPLEDSEWSECIAKMDEVLAEYRKEIPNISGAVCMAYLDDIEEYHYKWIDYLNKDGKS